MAFTSEKVGDLKKLILEAELMMISTKNQERSYPQSEDQEILRQAQKI